MSDTSSVASGKKSNASSTKQYVRKQRTSLVEHVFDQQDHEMIDLESVPSDISLRDKKLMEQQSKKKSVHFDSVAATGHIELRDLKEKDFLDLIEAKN